jgi:hypothetical protein
MMCDFWVQEQISKIDSEIGDGGGHVWNPHEPCGQCEVCREVEAEYDAERRDYDEWYGQGAFDAFQAWSNRIAAGGSDD